MTERDHNHGNLNESNEQLRELLDFLPLGIGVNIGGTLVYANPCLVKMLASDSVENVVGNKMLNYIHPDDRDLAIQRTTQIRETGKAVAEIEERFVRSNGETFIASVTSEPFIFKQEQAMLVVIQDITEKKIQQKGAEHAQRLESLGLMAGGIAHDFNNLLTVMMGNIAIMRTKLEHGLCVEQLNAIDEASQRASDLCLQMLTYAGKGQLDFEVIDLSVFIQGLAQMLKVSMHKNIQLHYDFSESPTLIQGDAAQVQQIMMNLILNANDAIGDKQGKIDIRTSVKRLDAASMGGSFYKAGAFISGDYVSVEVCDSGCGMDEKTQQHMFDPFFTTKFTGRGLGMSAVLGLVYGHQGAIQVHSVAGEGTCIRVFFPVSKEQTMPLSETKSSPASPVDATILVVDDEPSILKVAAMILEAAGYQVIQAVDGVDAIEKYKQYQDTIDIVLLDMTMPRMGGGDALKAMQAIDDKVKVLITSGYNEDATAGLTSGEQTVDFIQKPYRPETLLKQLANLIS